MKKTLLLLVLAALMGCSSKAQVKWQTIEQASQVELKGNNRLFFVDFTTAWCGWCKKMEHDTFSDPVVAAIMNQYFVPVKFDAEGKSAFTWNGTKYANTNPSVNGRPATHPFTVAVLGQKIGYPSFAFFGKDRKLITILQGYQPAGEFQIVLWYLASGDSNRYSFEQYQKIFDSEIRPVMMKKLGLAK